MRGILAPFRMLLLIAAIFLLPGFSSAARSGAVTEKASSSYYLDKTSSDLRTSLSMESQAFGAEVPGRPELNGSTLVKVGIDYESGKEDWGGKIDFSFGRYINLKSTLLSVREAYVSYNTELEAGSNSTGLSFSLGRRIEFWSEVDNNWDLGLWEPKYLEEPLRPEKQGLAGAMIGFSHSSGLEWVAYASPIFIPTMNPPLAVDNGSFVSDSRWTLPPSSSTTLIGKDTKLVYDLQIPNISQLVSRPGAGTRLSWGKNSVKGGPWLSFNFARKPINALSVKYDYRLAISSASAEGMVAVGPTVNYHSLWGADLGMRLSDVGFSISYLEDRPEQSLPADEYSSDGIARTEWIQQSPQSIQAYGLHADWNLRGVFQDPVKLQMDYLTTRTSDTRDVNSQGEDRGALNPHRLSFTKAFQFRAESLVFAGKTPLLLGWRYLRELDQKGNIYSLNAKVFMTRTFALNGGFDVLGPDDGSDANDDGRFLNSFRTNDRVYGGMTYVF